MKIGLGIGVTKPQGMPVGLSQSPAGLFTAGEQGAWYDPSDINLTWRRNLLTYSEQFDNAAWGKGGVAVTTTNATKSPDGTYNATKIVRTAATSWHFLYRSVSTSGPSIYSVYAKQAELTRLVLRDGSNNGYVTFDLSLGTIVSSSTSTGTIVSVGNGWYRCTATMSTSAEVDIFLIDNNGVAAGDSAGDGTSGIYIWGAQLELGNTATAYQRITDGIKDYLDYNPLPVLYQDAAGTIPCTAVEQPVGLMLDKSKGLVLGSELVTNGDFSNGTTGWLFSDAWSVVSGRAYMNYTGTGSFLTGTFTPVVGKWYQLTFDYQHISGTNLARIGGSQLYIPSATGRYTCLLLAATTTSVQFTTNSATAQCYIDNVSVRELPGNHAFQPTSANRPTLSARYNLLTKTEDFSASDWTKNNITVSGQQITETSANDRHSLIQTTPTAPSNSQNKIIIEAKAAARSRLVIQHGAFTIGYNLLNGTATDFAGSGASFSITPVGDGWYRCEFVKLIASNNIFGVLIASDNSYTTSYAGDDTQVAILLRKPDLRVSNDALNQPAYQRVNTATDYDTVGFKPYLVFNGTSSSMQTDSIDFTYGDKMFVCAGVRKLSDAALGMLTELGSGGVIGSFQIRAPNSGSATYSFISIGTSGVTAASVAAYAAPITNVVSGVGNISAPSATLRVNGTQAAIITTDQGTGNYGNYPLYIGARAGSSLFFNGRLYGMVIRGAETNSTDIYKTEDYLNTKTRAYFPNTLFLESGDNLLQEDGSYIILES